MTERKKLLLKLQNGFYTKEDLERLLDLIHDNPKENDDKIMRALWMKLENYEELEASKSEELMNRTRKLIEIEEAGSRKQEQTTKGEPRLFTHRNFLFRGVAAAIIFLVLSTFSFYMYENQGMVTASTQYGEQKEIILPDQSIVKLNSNSSITYNKNWDDKESRKVKLKGEAYFTVRKNLLVEQKFEVLTEDLKVQVLGTVFNVNAREKMTTVFLEEGRVNLDLENRDEDLGMAPGDIVSYSRKSRLSEKKQVVEEVPASWRNGTMEFRDTSLEDILQRFKEIYGIEVEYRSRASIGRRYRISIPLESLKMAFEVLKEVTRLDLTIKNKKIYVN